MTTRFTSLDGPGRGGDTLRFWTYVPVHQVMLRQSLFWRTWWSTENGSSLTVAKGDIFYIQSSITCVHDVAHSHMYVTISCSSFRLLIGYYFISLCLTPINWTVANLPLQSDCAICEAALHLARNFLRQLQHSNPAFHHLTSLLFFKESVSFSKLVNLMW